jgi:hypothetical protein
MGIGIRPKGEGNRLKHFEAVFFNPLLYLPPFAFLQMTAFSGFPILKANGGGQGGGSVGKRRKK